MPYLMAADLRAALAGSENLTGTAASLADEDLDDAIRKAQAEVDAKLGIRGYTVPFTGPPELVIDITTDIAAYLATLTYRRGEQISRDEPVSLAYTRAEQMLSQITSGAATLQAPGGTVEAASAAGVVTNPVAGDLWDAADFDLVQQTTNFDLRRSW